MIPEKKLCADEIVGNAVIRKWKEIGVPEPVIAFFDMKYKHEEEWSSYDELITPEDSDDFYSMCFESDFDEGQEDIRNIKIVPLSTITEAYRLEFL